MAIRDWNPFATAKPADSPALTEALNDLDRLGTNRPELIEACCSLKSILHAAFSCQVTDLVFEVDTTLLADAWRNGVPACRVGEVPPRFDPVDVKVRALAVLDVLREVNPHVTQMISCIRDGSLNLSEWGNEVLLDSAFAIDERAASLAIDASLARSVLRLALLPPLEALTRRLAPIRAASSWTQGTCPNCGSSPVLAESRGLEQRRHWRCGLCAADWEGERLRCPFCDENDHRKLSYMAVEGEQDRYRVSICESCGGRLKVVATLGPISAPGLLVAELATSHLDGFDI